ncbi:MAG: hypothetical protein CMJ87_04360 [Planctomycetes bacterium]|nr:hypothetical protein [Planctomycetota bacterium]
MEWFEIEEGDDDTRIIEKVKAGTADWQEVAREKVPYLKYLLSVDPGDPAITTMDPMARRASIFDGLRALLLEESRQQPLVVVVEDLHWVDEQTEAALAAVIDVIATVPVLLLLTARPGYTHTLGDRTYYTRLALRDLRPEESGALAEAVLQVSVLPERLRDLIVQKAEGNPFYIEEAMLALVETGVVARRNGTCTLTRPIEEIQVPDTLQAIILSRIDRLAAEAKQSLQLASVIGREFTVQLLQRIADIEAELQQVLGELKALELIYEKAYFPELAYMFKHARTHEVAYATLLRERRRTLHRGVGAAIEELYADRLPEHYETLAHHYYAGEAWEQALDYLVHSAQKAAAAYANRDALTYFDRALQTCGHLDDVPGERLLGIYASKAEVEFALGQWADGIASYHKLQEVARTTGNRAVEGQALGGAALGYFWHHQFDQAEATAQEALALAEELADDAARGGAIFVLGLLNAVRGNLAASQAQMSEAARISEATGQPFFEVLSNYIQALNYSWRGLYDQAHRVAATNVKAAERYRVAFPQLHARFAQAVVLGGHGQYGDAIAVAEELIALCQRMGDIVAQSRALNTLGWVYSELYNWERAREWNQHGLDLAVTVGDPEIIINAQINLADCAAGSGDRERACQELEELYRSLPKQHEWMKWRYAQHLMHSLGEALLAAGGADRALVLADECLALAEPTESRKNIVKGRRLRGQALLAQGKLAAAERELDVALAVAKEVVNPPQLWQTYAALGTLRQAQGQREEARQAYREALAVIDRVAAGLTDEQLRETFITSDHVQGIRQAAGQ